MKTMIKLEEAAIFLLATYLFSQLNLTWWIFPALLFLPDLSMLGYLLDNKIGAVIYNVVHHRGISVVIYIVGLLLNINVIALIGVILLAHSSLDRVFDYGLKYFKGFKYTNLAEL